jgi:hypothetical protein
MRKITIFILFWLIFISSGCTNQSALVPTQKPKSKLPVIVHIKTKNEVITVFSGQTEPLYNVTTKDGKVLGLYLSAQQLQQNLPGIYRLLKTSYADDQDFAVIWAGGSQQH